MSIETAINFKDIANKVLNDKGYTELQFEKDIKQILSVGFKLNKEQVNLTYNFAVREGQNLGHLGIIEVAEDLAKYAKSIIKTQKN